MRSASPVLCAHPRGETVRPSGPPLDTNAAPGPRIPSVDTWVQLGIASLALLVAAAGLTFNGLQFKQWNKELKARAKFDLSVSVRGEEGGQLELPPDTQVAECLVRVAVTNDGERAATTTLMNFLAPAFVESIHWVTSSGVRLKGATEAAPAQEDEVLTEPGQTTPYAAEYLDFEVDRIGRNSIFEVHVLMKVRIPSSNEIRVPVRATASADEIPDDVPEYEKDLLVVIQRERQG